MNEVPLNGIANTWYNVDNAGNGMDNTRYTGNPSHDQLPDFGKISKNNDNGTSSTRQKRKC